MKTKIAMLVGLVATSLVATGQEFSDKIIKELSFEKAGNHTLMIFNINGRVSVTGYAGEKVLIEVERVIRAKTDRRLEVGKSQLAMGINDRADTLMLYLEGTCSKFGKSAELRNRSGSRKTNNWGYEWNNWNHGDHCREEFDYEMNFTIKVPAGVNLYASTINNGDIAVENVAGTVYTNNINGGISLKNISGATDASTINGSVDLQYLKNPPEGCRYYSLNGDINASFKKGLTAMMTFESFNGEFYTNIDQLESMPTVVEKIPAEKGIRYKVLSNRFKIGKGGVLLDFETFNGNVYLREQ